MDLETLLFYDTFGFLYFAVLFEFGDFVDFRRVLEISMIFDGFWSFCLLVILASFWPFCLFGVLE